MKESVLVLLQNSWQPRTRSAPQGGLAEDLLRKRPDQCPAVSKCGVARKLRRGSVPLNATTLPRPLSRACAAVAYPGAAAALMKPANEDVLTRRPVSKAVGIVENNGPELLA